jgi:hypothetical protein
VPVSVQPASHTELLLRAHARLILSRKEEEIARARHEESSTSTQELQAKVRDATRNTWHWLKNYTETSNPHWMEEGRPRPNEPFPDKPYFEPTLDYIENHRITVIEKSRDMMISWVICGFITKNAMTVPEREIVMQTMESSKAEQLVEYCKTLYKRQPDWLRDAFPVPKSVDYQGSMYLEFSNGSVIHGIPGGAGAIRSYHPWCYFSDETAFQPDAGECYAEALSAAVKLILNSSAAPGWMAAFKNDIKFVGA